MAYEKREQLYEGKAKKVYATDDPEVVIVSYKDDATAFNGLKKGTVPFWKVILMWCWRLWPLQAMPSEPIRAIFMSALSTQSL